MAMTSKKTAVRDGHDVTEDSDNRGQVPLYELTMMEVMHSQLTPTMLKDGYIPEKRYIWEVR